MELIIGMLVLVVAVGGTLGAISSFAVLGQSTNEKTMAYHAAQQKLEEMKSVEFADVFARYNEVVGDDPAGYATTAGANFQVAGLGAQDDDADGLAGQILFPVNPGTPGSLREDWADDDFGFPHDLNGDGVVDADEHSGDYAVLPVRIRVQWKGKSGNNFVELQTMLSDI